MKLLSTLFLILLFHTVSLGQVSDSSADALREEGRLEAALEVHKMMFIKYPNDRKNTYDLARTYALLFRKDSAYHYLSIALKDDTSLWALADSDLYALTEDARWTEIENEQMERFQKHNKKITQPEYAKQLLRIILKDQAMDYYIDQAKKHFMKEGNAPQWYYPIGAFKQQIGKENYVTITKLIEEYGWPIYSTVGELAADAPLLVINHHESEAVRKKYLAQIKDACLEKEGSCMEFAKIQDRILVNENQPQIYGMQFRYNTQRNLEPFPIINPEQVDQRRKEIGLEPLKDYLKRKINYNWTVKQKKY